MRDTAWCDLRVFRFILSCEKQTSPSPALPQRPRGNAYTEGVHFSFDAVLPFDGNQQTVAHSAAAAVFLCPFVS